MVVLNKQGVVGSKVTMGTYELKLPFCLRRNNLRAFSHGGCESQIDIGRYLVYRVDLWGANSETGPLAQEKDRYDNDRDLHHAGPGTSERD
jgi:hypothetical protein